jgi:hypothetical protein
VQATSIRSNSNALFKKSVSETQRGHLLTGQVFPKSKGHIPFISHGDIKCLQNLLAETIDELV